MSVITPDTLSIVAVDLYRDIHKGIRAELFSLVEGAAATDPTSELDHRSLADHVRSVGELLENHADHEDSFIQSALEIHVPTLAEQVRADHESIDARIGELVERAAAIPGSRTVRARAELHWLQLDLASFTADYLAHQDLEERQIMPALDRAMDPDEVLGIHGAIVASIPPAELIRTLALMLPAMNVDDRTELLGGIQAGAPAEVFDGVWELTRSVLTPAHFDALASRLGR